MDEENNSSDAEYEGNDDSKQEEYISEDQAPASDELQRATVDHEDKRESQDEFTHNNRDLHVEQNGYKEVSDVDLNDDKEAHQDERNINLKHETDFLPQSLHKKYQSDRATEDLSSLRGRDQKIGNKNVNIGQNSEYSGDLLFKISQENLNKERNDQIEIEDQPNLETQHYIKMQQNKDSSNGRTYENALNMRDRRETQAHHQCEAKNCDTNESNESSIINNINKLSDKDLENLLNALPEDKKAILRKIMDKREITKKAGAVDDHGLDSSKLEGSFSIDSKSASDLATDASEPNKQSESEGSTTKTQENESDSGKIENKSSLNANAQTLEFNVEAATLSNYNKETFKNDNKREISFDEHRKELQEEVKSNVDSTDENSYDSSSNQEISDNEDWLESKGESKEDSNTQKREINRDSMFEDDESIRSLKESFSNADAYDDKNLNMEPLIRVKRRLLNHRVKKRDLSSLSSEVPFIPGFQNKECENMEINQLENKRCSTRDKQIKRNSVALADKDNIEANNSKLDKSSDLIKFAQYSVGSNNEFSNVKGLGGNIMQNSDTSNKILVEHDKARNVKLIRSGRTINPINSDSNVVSDNCLDAPNYQEEVSLESHLEKIENNVSRSKRI